MTLNTKFVLLNYNIGLNILINLTFILYKEFKSYLYTRRIWILNLIISNKSELIQFDV